MLFFQVLLLLGYFYVFLISRLFLKMQIMLHSFLLIFITGILIVLFYHWTTPIMPDMSWKLKDSFSPILQVLILLSVGIGLPYFLLSTTSILLQKWFSAIRFGESPYLFYAFSNAASLLAIISYPLAVEPYFTLKIQGLWWSLGFVLYSIVLTICCLQTFFSRKQFNKNPNDKKKITNPRKSELLWLLLPWVSSLMLLSITNLLTQSIAPIPFLWLLPLGLYLLSFILCFSGSKWYLRNLYAYTFLILTPFALVFSQTGAPFILLGILIYSLTLFCCCMICHGELYRLKPDPKHLDKFYLFIALSSAISGIFVGILAPLFFKGLWEIYIGFFASFIIAVVALIHYKDSFVYHHMNLFFRSRKEAYLCAIVGFPTIALAVSFVIGGMKGYDSVKIWRNFYGVLSVNKKTTGNMSVSSLLHGNIVHGSQFSSISLRREPTTYYSKKSGIGIVMLNYPREGKGLRVAVVGLGVGTLAAYGKKRDNFRFYEINPQVADIARNDFTYLSDSPSKIDIVLGDGRLSLEKEVKENKTEKYDILVMDAFSDDAIPMHLLTKEAFAIYLKRIFFPKGVVALNISNHYIDLKPVLVQVAGYFHLAYAFIKTSPKDGNLPSEWAFLTPNKKLLEIPSIARAKYPDNKEYKKIALWTDDYSNLLQILK